MVWCLILYIIGAYSCNLLQHGGTQLLSVMVLNPSTKLMELNQYKIMEQNYSWHPLAKEHPITFRILPVATVKN